MALSTEQVLNNRYRIVKLLGQGGFGAVYRAWDTTLARPCALKENLDTTQDARRQFEREARILANLSHPNLPRVYDHFSITGQGQYLVMEFIDGEDLQQMLERSSGPLPEGQALSWIEQVCAALRYLHLQNPPIIHRDIKPANIKITPDGRAILVDFGIAKIYDPHLKTTVGARAVTPGYSPPEQYSQGETDARSDVYALGATLYALLTHKEPPESVAVISQLTPPPEPVHILNTGVSPQISAAVQRAMHPSREARFRSVDDFRSALMGRTMRAPAGMLPAGPSPARRAARTPSTLLVVGLVVVCGIGALLAGAVLAGFFRNASISTAAPLAISSPPGATASPVPVNTSPAETVVIFPTEMATWTPVPQVATEIPILPAPTDTPAVQSGQDDTPMTSIPAGSFMMGMSENIAQWHLKLCNQFAACDIVDYEDAMPRHEVFLDAYALDIHEVTNAQYQACVQAGVCQPVDLSGQTSYVSADYAASPRFYNYPVVGVTWQQALAYCQWTGKSLPTEAQFERAASGDAGWLFSWGNPSPLSSLDLDEIFPLGKPLANYCDRECPFDAWKDPSHSDGYAGPAPVMSFQAGAFGLYDMVGNVLEWVMDYYSASFYNNLPQSNPVNDTPGELRTTRGGGWNNGLYHSTAYFRRGSDPNSLKAYIGFRCMR
ncbi:MAG: SUMF1/EgtB/PvdO family nonheme iron enzyme [Chloroflexota bacterium]